MLGKKVGAALATMSRLKLLPQNSYNPMRLGALPKQALNQ
ncbi:hypothetical protein BPUTEOMOX_1892 [methanotrophic endosymbiont of Bathymodiolus puteoserpentis (Logatchev)]|nr:hypothetical protein BPUTEOMOX_1892 [methanotrophic endosymbiont of Bathymodiolus puteoserpentis (Logatchev)]